MLNQEISDHLLLRILAVLPDTLLVLRDGKVACTGAACLSVVNVHPPVGTPASDAFTGDLAALVSELAEDALSDRTCPCRIWHVTRGEGDAGVYAIRASKMPADLAPFVIITATDISLACSSDCDVARVNRTLSVLFEIKHAQLHSSGEKALLRSVCKSLVMTGGHAFAWAGYANGSGANTKVAPAACFAIRRREAEAISSWVSKANRPTPSAAAAFSGDAIVVDDARTERNYALAGCAGTRYLSSIDVPIKYGNKSLGVLSVYDAQANRFGSEERRLYCTLAENLALGITSSRNRANLQQALDQTNTISRQLMRSQEQVKQHLSREIHDQLGSLTTGILMSLNNCEQMCKDVEENGIAGVKELVFELIHGVRNLSQTLRPPMLDDFGLLPTIEWYAEKFGERAGIKVHLQHRGVSQRMDPDIEITVFRLLQECLTNIARHADTDVASVSLFVTKGQVRITVQDYGRGFDPTAVQRTTTSTGLMGMRERTALLGGTLTIDSAPGRGTRIAAVIPLIQINKGGLFW